jgi:hypothetical protein
MAPAVVNTSGSGDGKPVGATGDRLDPECR